MKKHSIYFILAFVPISLLFGCSSGGSFITSTKIQPTLIAANQAPTASLTADGTSFLFYNSLPHVTFTIGYNDPEASNGTYTLDYGDESSKETGTVKSGETLKLEHTYIPHCPVCTLSVILVVTDDKGLTATSKIDLEFFAGIKT